MYSPVIDVKPLDNYQLYLTFKDGETKIFDMRPFLQTNIFKPLNDKCFFSNVRVSFDTIEWDDEIDIDPETLYNDSIKI